VVGTIFRADPAQLLVFAKVVEGGSLTAAARALEMPKSTVSRRLAELEARLGARLLQRTTRALRLTEAGRAYYAHAQRVVEALEAAEAAVHELSAAPKGRLRVTVPLDFAPLGPVLARFMARYPDIELEVVCADRVVDLVDEGFDVAIRVGALGDSRLVARSLGALRSIVVASPRYLDAVGGRVDVPRATAPMALVRPKRARATRGRRPSSAPRGAAPAVGPAGPEVLATLDGLVFGAGAARSTWTLTDGNQVVQVRPRVRYVVNDFDLLHAAARDGVGVAMLPSFRCAEDLAQGRLVHLLPAWGSPAMPIHAVYPSAQHLAPKLRVLLDHLREEAPSLPWAEGIPAPTQRRAPRYTR
jgi:DNA-binding transcriptional LysR family regulator